jgi:hypothetical protein
MVQFLPACAGRNVRRRLGGSEPSRTGCRHPGYTRAVSFHLRPPSVDKGVSAFWWAFGFFLYIWLGQLALGIGKGSAFILAAVAGGAIFLFIRLFGEGGARRARS